MKLRDNIASLVETNYPRFATNRKRRIIMELLNASAVRKIQPLVFPRQIGLKQHSNMRRLPPQLNHPRRRIASLHLQISLLTIICALPYPTDPQNEAHKNYRQQFGK